MLTEEMIESLKTYYRICRLMKHESILSGALLAEASAPGWWDN